MAEICTLSTPLPATSTLRISALDLHVKESMIRIVLEEYASGDWVLNGRSLSVTYSGPTADAFMISLNKANITTQSLHLRVISKLIDDGKIAGTLSGTVP